MPEGRKLEFIPEPHTDYIFRVESENRFVRSVAKLVTPVALVLIRTWFWLRYRASSKSPPASLVDWFAGGSTPAREVARKASASATGEY
jgi:hypothetical protein